VVTEQIVILNWVRYSTGCAMIEKELTLEMYFHPHIQLVEIQKGFITHCMLVRGSTQ